MHGLVRRDESGAQISRKMMRLLGGVSLLAQAAVPVQAQEDTLRIISLNTWGERSLAPEATDLFATGNYDVITIQEYNNSYGNDLRTKLIDSEAGAYSLHPKDDKGLASRLRGETGLGGIRQTPYVKLPAEGGRPATIVATEHLNYYDDANDFRVTQAKQLNEWAAGTATPIIMTGDFNAGDVSERGLLDAGQQEYLLTEARKTKKAYLKAWALQYVARNHLIGSEKYNAAEAYIKGTSDTLPPDLFTDETYPVEGNTPYTMNILKKEYQLLQNPEDKEPFAPHELADGSTTWPSIGEDDEAFRWPSWGRAKIDHFVVSRPYAKWWELADSADDPYVGGVLDQSLSTKADGVPLSDHEPIAHAIRWVGPKVEEIGAGSGQIRLTFDGEIKGSGEFRLSRNNGRTDVYLGQLSDANGQPIYRKPQEISQDRLAFLFANTAYDRHDTMPYEQQLSRFVPEELQDIYEDKIAQFLDSSGPEYYRTVIQNYFDAHRGEFPGVDGIDSMSWEQWGHILLDHVSEDLILPTVQSDEAWKDLWRTLKLDDPEVRAQLSQLTGLDFENDPYAPLKVLLDCSNAQHLGLQSARDMCVDNHQVFKDIAISGGKTVAIDESEALGPSGGVVALDNGGIRTAGPNDQWASWTDPVTRIDKAIRLDGRGWIDVSHPNVPVEMAQSISGAGSFEKRGQGVLELMATNSYDGSTTVEAGILRAGRTGAFVDGGAYIVNDGALDLGGYDLTMSSLSGQGGALEIGSGDLLIDQAGTTIYAGSVVGDGHVTKAGAGVLELSGNSPGFNGTTELSSGRLTVNGHLGGTVNVTEGTLGGNGTIGTTMVADGATLAPGNSIGTLTVDGNLTLSSGSILKYELGRSGPSSGAPGVSDRIDVAGDLSLAGMLDLSQSGNPADGTIGLGYYRLMTYGGTLSGDGLTFGNKAELSDPSRYAIQAGAGNVDLFIAASGAPGDNTLQHWQGGDGTWNADGDQWLNQNGEQPDIWAGHHAIFKNQPGGFDAGTITVVGGQSFKGLQFVDDGYRLEGDGALRTDAGGSEIRVLADRAEIATQITGTGGIAKTGAGTLVLSGENSYHGGTTIMGGVVQVANDGNLGAVSGGLTFNGGTLATTSSFDSDRMVAMTGSGTFEVAEATTFSLTGTVSGAGNLIKRGDGTLSLSGENAYGKTLVEAGKLSGDASSISGDIANAGTVEFDQAADAAFAGNIAGYGGNDGTMVKLGLGQLALEGTSALDWTIEQGGITTAAERFAGDAAIGTDGAFTLDQAERAAYAGVISGQGAFTITGGGGVLLTGDSTDFAGTTSVAGGGLFVGDAEGNGALGGSVDVLKGAVLGGSGIVGSGVGSQVAIASGGTLSPGNSIGTLTVDGDLTFAQGSVYKVEVDPDGTESDLVDVTGTVTLDGGSVAHIGAKGSYDLRSTYTILSAGKLEGRFGDVTSSFAFLTPRLSYDYDLGRVGLELARNDRDFASVAETRNQTATARGIESIGIEAGHGVYDAIALLPDDGDLIRTSLDQLSGEIFSSIQSGLITSQEPIRSSVNERLGSSTKAKPGASVSQVGNMTMAEPTIGTSAWFNVYDTRTDFSSTDDAAPFSSDTGGIVMGVDDETNGWRVGLMAGASQSDFSGGGRGASGDSNSFTIGAYGGTQWDALGLRAGVSQGWHDVSTSRHVAVGDFSDHLDADYNARSTQAFGELGYEIRTDVARVEPFVNLAHVRITTDNFRESGGDAALSADSNEMNTTFSTLGVRGEVSLGSGPQPIKAIGVVGWRHAYGDLSGEPAQRFTGGKDFTVSGSRVGEDVAVLEAGLKMPFSDRASLGINYRGQYSDEADDHGVQGSFSWSF